MYLQRPGQSLLSVTAVWWQKQHFLQRKKIQCCTGKCSGCQRELFGFESAGRFFTAAFECEPSTFLEQSALLEVEGTIPSDLLCTEKKFGIVSSSGVLRFTAALLVAAPEATAVVAPSIATGSWIENGHERIIFFSWQNFRKSSPRELSFTIAWKEGSFLKMNGFFLKHHISKPLIHRQAKLTANSDTGAVRKDFRICFCPSISIFYGSETKVLFVFFLVLGVAFSKSTSPIFDFWTDFQITESRFLTVWASIEIGIQQPLPLPFGPFFTL